MISLKQFAEYLESDTNLNEAIGRLSKDLFSRNIAPLYVFNYSADNEDLTFITDSIRLKFGEVDESSVASIKDTEYDWLRRAVGEDLISLRSGKSIFVIGHFLENVRPSINDYIESIDDITLPKSKGLQMDDEGLALIDNSIELRKHALLLNSQDTMLYPHPFLRRNFTGNFVNNISIAENMNKKGARVELRIDPLRESTPDKYIGWEERDFWFGPPFNPDIFDNTSTQPARTIHRTLEKDLHVLISQPPMYTVFRTNIMDKTTRQRQFFVEEYMPYKNLIDENLNNPSGVTDRYVIQKFAHFVYDQSLESFSHIDCAVRIFTKDEYRQLYDSLVSGKDLGSRVGERKKLAKVSGVLDFDDIQIILYEFFRGNSHIEEYFTSSKVAQ